LVGCGAVGFVVHFYVTADDSYDGTAPAISVQHGVSSQCEGVSLILVGGEVDSECCEHGFASGPKFGVLIDGTEVPYWLFKRSSEFAFEVSGRAFRRGALLCPS
jgi:hypothetical protein